MGIARTASQASTELVQKSARHVPRTRTRLLKAVLGLIVLATQATVAMPKQEAAQRVSQASTNLQESIMIARTVSRASTGMLQDKLLKHHARTAARASTGRAQEDLLKLPAQRVPRTRTRLLRAVLEPPVLATQATVGTPAQEHAQHA